MRSISARTSGQLYGRRIARSTRSEPDWSGTWRWRADPALADDSLDQLVGE
jgi:hypothetical protein